MKKSKFIFVSVFSLFLPVLSIQAEELKGNKTDVHVKTYGEQSKNNIKVGMDAPNFSTTDSNGKKVTLSDFKGKNPVLMVFYPGDSTPGCTRQLSAIRDDYKNLIKLGVKVFGINPGDEKSHNSFIKEQNFPFQLLMDKEHKIIDAYDSMGSLGFVNRTVVLVNKKGKIALFERGAPDVSANKIAKLL